MRSSYVVCKCLGCLGIEILLSGSFFLSYWRYIHTHTFNSSYADAGETQVGMSHHRFQFSLGLRLLDLETSMLQSRY